MREDEFDECIGKLRDVFGKAHYSEQRASSLWAGLSHFPNGVLTKAIEGFILSAKSAPLYGDLRDACETVLRSEPKPAWKLIARDCNCCGGNGVVEMIGYLDDKLTTAFASCDLCDYGRSMQGQGPKVVPTHGDLSHKGFELRRVRANIPVVAGMGPGLTALCWSMHKAILEKKSEPELWKTKLGMLGLTPDEAWEAYELEWKTRKPGRINNKCQGRSIAKSILQRQRDNNT